MCFSFPKHIFLACLLIRVQNSRQWDYKRSVAGTLPGLSGLRLPTHPSRPATSVGSSSTSSGTTALEPLQVTCTSALPPYASWAITTKTRPSRSQWTQRAARRMETQKVLQYSTPPLTNIRAAENPERAVSATSPVIVFETGRVRRRCDCGAQDPWPGLQPGLHEEVFASRKGFRKLPCARPLPRMGRRMTRTPQTRPRGASSLL